MRGNNYLHDFLSVKDQKDFEKLRKKYEKEPEPSEIFDHYMHDGKAEVSSSTDIWEFSYHMPDFIESYTELYKNIRLVSKVFVEQSQEISKTLHQMGKYFDILGDLYNKIHMDNQHELHKNMGNVITAWGNTYIEQGMLMKEKFSRFYKYNFFEGDPMKEFIKKRFQIKESYAKADTKLSERKTRLLKSKDYKKWELTRESMNNIALINSNEELARKKMLPKETAVVTNKRHLLNHMSNQVYHQIRGMVNNNFHDMSEHLVDVSKGV